MLRGKKALVQGRVGRGFVREIASEFACVNGPLVYFQHWTDIPTKQWWLTIAALTRNAGQRGRHARGRRQDDCGGLFLTTQTRGGPATDDKEWTNLSSEGLDKGLTFLSQDWSISNFLCNQSPEMLHHTVWRTFHKLFIAYTDERCYTTNSLYLTYIFLGRMYFLSLGRNGLKWPWVPVLRRQHPQHQSQYSQARYVDLCQVAFLGHCLQAFLEHENHSD